MTEPLKSDCFHPLLEPAAPLPKVFPNPFLKTPHPLAKQAAEELMKHLTSQKQSMGQNQDRGGKMFGVLVVQNDMGRIGWLQAFSGQLEHKWHHRGFVPPLFDTSERELFWPQGEATIVKLEKNVSQAKHRLLQKEAEYKEWSRNKKKQELSFNDALKKKREARHKLRGTAADTAALDHQSKEDSRHKREFNAAAQRSKSIWLSEISVLRNKFLAAKNEQRQVSNHNLDRLYQGYQILNPDGESLSLKDFGEQKPVPGGTGDCAGAKLLGFANRAKLRPIALAEFWWGHPPKTGGRWHGEYYPSCKGKCGLLLPHLLKGLPLSPPPTYGEDFGDSFTPQRLFEDSHYLITNKPSGLLSVPGKGSTSKPSLLCRLNASSKGSYLSVHRLDQATSGIIVLAKSKEAQTSLARLFNFKEIKKEYTAIVKDSPEHSSGTISLPIAPDWPNRPMQMVDKALGKAAETHYEVIESNPKTTRIKLFPQTGRTHQLRVHCSHPEGLACPIVGDSLYGICEHKDRASRLHLHASRLVFKHPYTQKTIDVISAPPF